MDEIQKAAEECLLPLSSCAWHEHDVPLQERGISFGWLYDFVAKIDSTIGELWARFYSDQQASVRYDTPWPERPLYSEMNLTTRQLVRQLIIPLTAEIESPLYARVPLEQRGAPSLFISHTWDSFAVRAGHGSLDMVLDHNRNSFVWIDMVCYNQHRVESVALDMNSIISAIGKIAFVLTTAPFFTRSWCLWELVCAHRADVDIAIYDQTDRIKYKYWSSELGNLPKDFGSVTELSATEKSDQEAILQAMISTFGSTEQADRYIHGVLATRRSSR
jgi:hypothetical protein